MLPPFYYIDVPEDGVIEAYSRSIEGVGDDRLRVYLYRIPWLSGVDIGIGVVEKLLEKYPTVVAGIKDSSRDWPSTVELCARFGNALDVLVGSERDLRSAMQAGACGCVQASTTALTASSRIRVASGRSEYRSKSKCTSSNV